MVQRKKREVLVFVGTMLLSGLISIAVFPFMLSHIFTGYRGEESVKMLMDSSWLNNIRFFGSCLDMISGGVGIVIICAAILIILYKISCNNINNPEVWIYTILLPGVLYFSLVSKIAVMQTSRYISPLYGSWIIIILAIVKSIIDYIEKDSLRCVGTICIVSFLLGQGYRLYTWPELYVEASDAIATARQYGEHNECVYVYENLWRSMPSYQEFIQYPQITFVSENDFDLLFQEHYTSQYNIVIYFDKAINEDEIEERLNDMLKITPNMQSYQKLYEYSYNVAYYME